MYSENLQAAAQALCRGARHLSLLGAGFLAGGMPIEDREAHWQVCSGVGAAVQLQLYSATVLLFMVPMMVLYLLELSLKVGFLRGLQDQHPDRCVLIQPIAAVLTNEAWVVSVLFVAFSVLAWFACESVISALMPMSCDHGSASGVLHWQGLHSLLL